VVPALRRRCLRRAGAHDRAQQCDGAERGPSEHGSCLRDEGA